MPSSTWTTPTTRVQDELIEPSDWNTDLTENLKFLHDPPAVAVYNNAAISINNDTPTVLTFNTERYDSDAQHDTSVNTSRLTAAATGIYLVTAKIEWASNATGYRKLAIRKGGSTFLGGVSHDANGSVVTQQTIAVIEIMSVGEYVEVVVQQTSGSALNVTRTADVSPEFQMTWIHG